MGNFDESPEGARPATVDDIHEIARALPGVTDGGARGRLAPAVYQVSRRSFIFFRNPRPDAFDPDTGERYLSKVFSDEWMQENQLLDTPRVTVEQLLARRQSSAPALVSVAPAAAVRQALNLMNTWDVSQIPVVDAGEPVGTLTEQSLMTKALAQPALLDRPVREVMEPPLPVIESSFPTDRLGPMLTRESPAALVRKDGHLVGIVSRYDVLQQLIGSR